MSIPKIRRSQRGSADELTAAATLDLTKAVDMRYLQQVIGYQRQPSAQAWTWYDNIGEIHYAVSRGARIAGYTKLKPYKLNSNGTIGKEIKGGMEADIVERIQSPYGGVRQLCSRYFTQMKIPADSYLIRCRDEDGEIEGYDFISADEIDLSTLTAAMGASIASGMVASGIDPSTIIRRITTPGGRGGAAITRDVRISDFLGRVWRPSARYIDLADSPMAALQLECELLNLLTLGLKAKMLSRLALNGIFYIPTEISQVRTAMPKGSDTEVTDNEVVNRLITAATYAVTHPDTAEAAIPIFMSGPAQFADALRHIVFDREIYLTDMKLRQELIDRILMGLDVQPQDVRGLGDSSHWSAWAVSDDERRVNINPEIENMCWALTRMVLRAEMAEMGATTGRINNTVLWYDLTDANVKTNLAEDSRQLHDRALISDEAARRMSGVIETDSPSEIEQIRAFGRKNNNPYLATYGMDTQKKFDWDKVAATKPPGPSADSPADPAKVGPGVGDPGSPHPADQKTDTPRKLRPA